MKKFISNFITVSAIILSIPTFLILISWNALPGESLYSLKTGMEDVVLKLIIKTPLASQLSVKYTERRYSEATRLLSQKGSTLGYTLLVEETQKSKNIIVGKNDAQKGQDLVQKIEEYQKNIEEKQFAIQTGGIKVPVASTGSVPGATTTPTKTPTPAATPSVPTVGVVQTPKPTALVVEQAQTHQEVIDDLEKTNDELEDIKKEIRSRLPDNASDRAHDVQDSKLDNKEEKDDNRNDRERE